MSDRIDRIATDEIHSGRTPGIAIGIVGPQPPLLSRMAVDQQRDFRNR